MKKSGSSRNVGILNSSAILLWISTGPFAMSQVHAQDQICSIIAEPGTSLLGAKEQFADQCPGRQRQDCDRIDGVWQCSTENLFMGSMVLDPITQPPGNTADSPCTATGSSRRDAIQAFESTCPTVREDCDPIGGGEWMCSSENVENNTVLVLDLPDDTTEETTDETTGQTPTNTPDDEIDDTPSTPQNPTDNQIGLFSGNDLLALHYDNCPDRDDGHATVAGKAVVDAVGITNVVVVNGTCGADIKDKFQKRSPEVTNAVWGSTWWDAHGEESSTVQVVADLWAATISNNSDVWVAEGGPSDFTANVLRRISSMYPSVDLERIHVVQHSGWNENMTSNTGLSLVQRVTDYIRIDGGNTVGNGTAGFNTKSSSFVSIALSSRYANEWEVAFDYLNPNSKKLDFSDTVELLHIVGDTDTKDVDDFAERYLK